MDRQVIKTVIGGNGKDRYALLPAKEHCACKECTFLAKDPVNCQLSDRMQETNIDCMMVKGGGIWKPLIRVTTDRQ